LNLTGNADSNLAGVEIWVETHSANCNYGASLLDAGEVARLAAMSSGEARSQYVTGRTMLRLALALYTGLDPRTFTFDNLCLVCGESHGKPILAGELGYEFSITHAGPIVGVAVARHTPIGLDVEPIRPALRTSGRLALSAGELADVQRLRAAKQIKQFLMYWTMKEACLKCLGVGLHKAPATLDFSATPMGFPVGLEICQIGLNPGFVMSLAVNGNIPEVTLRLGLLDGEISTRRLRPLSEIRRL
jgi:4'-phosphopantetheinyl transferase